jgi:acyl carrier protein
MTPNDYLPGVFATLQSIAPEVAVDQLRLDSNLRDQVDLDSMDWLHVIVGLQERFGVAIPEDDYKRLDTLQHIVQYLVDRA